jgi:integrase
MAVTFQSEQDALNIPAPANVRHVEVWNREDTWMGIRVSRPKKSGHVLRVWICRYKKGKKHTKQNIGRVEYMRYDRARHEAFRLFRVGKEAPDDIVVPTLMEAYESYCKDRVAGWSPATIADYKKAIGLVDEWHDTLIDRITAKHISEKFDSIMGDVAQSDRAKKTGYTGKTTAVSVMRLLRAIFNDAVADGAVVVNPVAPLVRKGRMKRERRKASAIKVKDWPKLWLWLKAQDGRTRDYIVIGLFTAMRLEVLNSLRWDRYDDTQRSYLLEPDQRGNKTGERVPIPLPDYVVENILRPRWKAKGEDDVWILPSPRYPGKPMRSIRNALDRLLKDTGIDVTVHDLRRTSASLALRATNSMLIVQRLLTHNLQSALERDTLSSGYVRTEEDVLMDAMNAMVQFLMNIVGDTYLSLLPRSSFHAGSSPVSPAGPESLVERDPSLPDPEAPKFSDEEIEEWLEDPSKYDPWYWQHEKKT